jgi:hypothetical protein
VYPPALRREEYWVKGAHSVDFDIAGVRLSGLVAVIRGEVVTPSYLTGIKKLERNQAVLGETRMWAAFLCCEPNLLDQRDRILDFRELGVFEVGRGIDDELWRKGLGQNGAWYEILLFEQTA